MASANSMGVTSVFADTFHLEGIEEGLAVAKSIAAKHQRIYLTICMDAFAAPYAPGVSAPQPLGLLPWHVIPIIRFLARSGRVIGFDIAELSPPHDVQGITAKLGASLMAEYLFNIKKMP